MNAAKSIAAKADMLRAAELFDSDDVPSPCISVCRMDAAGALCLGCFRTLEEIAGWSRMEGAGRRAVWQVVLQRAGV